MGYLLDLAKTVTIIPVRSSPHCNEKNEINEKSSPSVFIPPPKIVESGGVIWKNPYPQGTPEARQETLREIMLAMFEYAGSPAADAEIDNIHALVLAGKAQLADYRLAVEGLTQRRSTNHD